MKKFFSGAATVALVLLLAFADVMGSFASLPAAVASTTPSISLNGTVAEGDKGYLNSKSIILSTGTDAKVNYRLTPSYSTGEAVGVEVKVYLPSLEYVNGEYHVVERGRTPSALGVQGTVVPGADWTVKSDTTVKGGPIVMRYNGNLGAGTNPAFDIMLSTYNDGTSGPYGGVPEGTRFELNGFVSYEMFDRVAGTSWETPNQMDDQSRVSVISSDLRWEAGIESYVPGGGSDTVPIWDRYQYIDYMYAIENTSDNLASNIDGYSVTFDIDSKDTSVNGIIPFDINRWKYNEGGAPTKNDDPDETEGQFVGVPGEGGILIYDVTDWDEVSELTDEIPYSYSGTGMIKIDRELGANKQALTPEGAAGDTKRKYLVSLPLSRQGFPNPPAKFKVGAVTNILFAKTANWSKTSVVIRDIVAPTYDFSFEHTTKQPEVVYGYETFNEISGFTNSSNAPIFDPTVEYSVDEDFVVDRVTYEFDESYFETLKDSEITYTYIDEKTGDPVTKAFSKYTMEQDPNTQVVTLTFDISSLNDLDWDRTFTLSLVERLNAGIELPVNIKVYGSPERVGDMTATATMKFIEKIASNDDFGNNTTYTEVEHEKALDATFKVIYPDEVVPSIEVHIDTVPKRNTVKYEAEAVLDFWFGVNKTTAKTSSTTLVLNSTAEMLKHAELTLKEALFLQAQNVRVSYTTLDDATPVEIDLTGYSGQGDFTFDLPKRAAAIIVETDEFTSDGKVNFVSVKAKVGNGLAKKHEVTGELSTYQPKPYDKTAVAKATGIIDIQLPNELLPVVDVVGVYGVTSPIRTKNATTNVSYESTFGVEYMLSTRDVNSPSSEYVIDMLPPTKAGELVFQKISLLDAYLDNVTDAEITFVDKRGTEQKFATTEVSSADITLSDIKEIIISGKNLKLQNSQAIAFVEYKADIEIGSSQTVRATFTGTQEAPYETDATATEKNKIEVRETQTKVKVEGVNQVNEKLGVGNKYSVDIYRWWNQGYTYNKQDYTLDQGYKSLGGFTSTLTRPTSAVDNNDQRTSVDVALPYEHFDLYYLKIRSDMQQYIDTVDIYRMVDGEEVLWEQVPGTEWTDNSSEGSGFWRIGTARPEVKVPGVIAALSRATSGDAERPFYKEAWDADVRPQAPVSRVIVNLEFARVSTDAAPQMPGLHNDVVEYMGRFHSSSETGKKATTLKATDKFGTQVELKREASASINSLVAYPYAQSRTGAHDNTSLANKVITMGNVGEYLATIWNVNNASWSYYSGHGPDVYIPAATEYDEWLGLYDPASFHDKLVYEFVYPASPKDNATYNLDARHFVVENSTTLKYLTGIKVFGEDKLTGGGENSVETSFDQPLTAAARFTYDNEDERGRGIHANADATFTVSFGEDGGYPEKFEADFKKVAGFGDNTAEIDGVNEDKLGLNLNEVDVRVGGVVNGNQALKGTTNLYRQPEDTNQKTLMHSTSATLTGYTPKLGAQLHMKYVDGVTVYDYGADGVTPNTTKVALGVKNSSEADIQDVLINFKPDSAFRSQLIEIPQEIFAGGDWSAKSLVITQGTTKTEVDLKEFVLNDVTGNYELDLLPLFQDGTLATADVNVTFGGAATLKKMHVDNIAVAFTPKDATVRLWGSLANADAEVPGSLPQRMHAGADDVLVTGVWVDEDENGHNWNSKPTFITSNLKASNGSIMYHSSFNVNAEVTSYNPIFVSEGTGNRGQKPTLTHTSNANSAAAPRLYSRVAQLDTTAVHMNNDFSRAQSPNLFFDADTNTQINYANVAVGDTVKVLYELKNVGTGATDDRGPGMNPVFKPVAHVEIPAATSLNKPMHMEITSVEATSDFLGKTLTDESLMAGRGLDVSESQVSIDRINKKRADLKFDLTLEYGESVFFYVEYTATDVIGGALTESQNTTMQWNVYARPAYTHHFMNYNSNGVRNPDGTVTGTTAKVNFDGDNHAEDLGLVQNTLYRYANPQQLVIESKFDEENVSGKDMTLTVRTIRNEIMHDNTKLDLYLTLDKGARGGFELTEIPAPTYPDWFTDAQFAAPQVYYLVSGGNPAVQDDWVLFDPTVTADQYPLDEINQLKVEYGIVPALGPDSKVFEVPSFDIQGIGHWKYVKVDTEKYYDIYSVAKIDLTHMDVDKDVAAYTFTTEAWSRAYKAIPQVEFNIQSFDTSADPVVEALPEYSGSAVGKTGYVANDYILYRLTAKNHTTNQKTSTNTPYGKAPLQKPVIFDKIPEYLNAWALADYKNADGTFRVEDAIAAGVLEIRVTNAAGEARPFNLPSVTVRSETGLDIAGAQQFANNVHNTGRGLLSSTEPTATDDNQNPAQTIKFDVFTYSFDNEDLGRGEQLEIIYKAQAREKKLPVATYANGQAVFAPLFGWYSGNSPVANNAKNVAMDMASLLHDAGISGNRGHEMTKEEFLSNSSSWQPGGTASRRVFNANSGTENTFYDETANKQKTHQVYLREPAAKAGVPVNDLYTGFTTGGLDDNFNFAAKKRVNDGAIESAERILWSQDGMQLNRAWLYGASEMLPQTERKSWGVDGANFYEHDRSLNSINRHRHGYSEYVEDDYTYAVQLHEKFTVRLHAANLGDRSIESGLEYTEVLPLGISPYDEQGELLGVTVYDGAGVPLDDSKYGVDVQVIQTPTSPNPAYRAPAQSQEGGTYAELTREDMVPYVVQVKVAGELKSMFNAPGTTDLDKYQYLDMTVRAVEELAPSADGRSYWHDEFTLTTIEEEEYLEIYGNEAVPSEPGKSRKGYGAFNRDLGAYNLKTFPNDGMPQGIDLNDLTNRYYNVSSFISVEPWGKYIRGLNAQATVTATDTGKPALVTGDQLAMRKPTLRVWNSTTKDSYDGVKNSAGDAYNSTIQDFNVDLYEEFTLNSTVENQQLEVQDAYNRTNSGYNYYSGDNYNADIWLNAPQTIGGARGSWFEPTVSIALPYGVVPVMTDGTYARYYSDIADVQQAMFSAKVNDITHSSSTEQLDVSEYFDVKVELLEEVNGKRFVLHFTPRGEQAADIAYGQSLVISPRVVTIDTPTSGVNADDSKYREILTFANTKRPVFNPIVAAKYTTGSPTSITAKDLGLTHPNTIKSLNGISITENDRKRRDSTSTWSTNMGVLKITERLISETKDYDVKSKVFVDPNNRDILAPAVTPKGLASKHDKAGAFGGTVLNLKKPSITNTTKAANYVDSVEQELIQVDAAGNFWYVTEVKNSPTKTANPHEEIKSAGAVHNSRFIVTQFVTNFAEVTGEVRIKLGNETLDCVLAGGTYTCGEDGGPKYLVEQLQPSEPQVDDLRNRIQWQVTTPENSRGTLGQLKSGESFKLLYEVQLVDGYEDNIDPDEDVWTADELVVDSFVSLVTDDTTLIAGGSGAQDERDFIVQSPTSMTYHAWASDVSESLDVDSNGEMESVYAKDDAEIEILKPKAEVRINTSRPRIPYSNGLSGDTYFNSSDTIEYLITHAQNTGSGLKEFVVESILPTDKTDESTVSVSNKDITTTNLFVSSGKWEFPESIHERLLADNGKTVDDVFKTYVYVSLENAEDGYEAGDWKLLNQNGTLTGVNEVFEIPAAERLNLKKVRVVVKTLDPNNYLVPQGLKLDIDADPSTPDVKESVIDTDPDNHSTSQYPTSVTDNAIKMGLRVASDAKSTLFIFGTAQAWGNYVGTAVTKLAQSETRSYLTPSRPVINVLYDALYYRIDPTRPDNEAFGWSDILALAPKVSKHLKFKGEFINADETMWSRDEDNIYAKDTLVDPFVTFQLPRVMESGEDYTYVPSDRIDATHPLSDDHRSTYALPGNQKPMWTWKLLRADGTEASKDSVLKHKDFYAGPWAGSDRNVVSVWFDGIVFPGDKIVVEFIGSVDAYSPGAEGEDLKSTAFVTNNTGLLHPLNSQQNADNRLGYSTDNNDLNNNKMLSDRLVFSEKTMFQYETYDNFGKRKISYSDLNEAGTVAPQITPVREGGLFSFEVSVENSKSAGDRPYPYPIIYDVLPFADDTSIVDPNTARESQYSAWLQPDNMVLERDGRDKKVYSPSEYTVYVGPFTKKNGEIVDTDMAPHSLVATEAYYDSLGTPNVASVERDKQFVTLDEIKSSKNSADLMKRAKTLLVLFKNPDETLPGENKLKFTYNMQAPLNAPAVLDHSDDTQLANASLWNSFMATQRQSGFNPQQSNNAGVFATEREGDVSIGNYVWNDVDYNGIQDEGDTYEDENGRTLLKPSKDLNYDGTIDDPGINGVKVSLLTAAGYNVDYFGNPIHKVGKDWEVVDEATGQSVLDEVFSLPIKSKGPLVTVTETDIHGNAGYYTFSNIRPNADNSEYRVMFEFPREFDEFSVTTKEVFTKTGVETFTPGEVLSIPADVDDAALVAITKPAAVTAKSTDKERMSFDLGVAQTIKFGGTVFEEKIDTLNGLKDGTGEPGIEGYHVYVKHLNGDTVRDHNGDPMVQKTDANGTYQFTLLPVDREYYLEVTDKNDEFNSEWPVSPIVHNADPFVADNDNDAFTVKDTTVVKTNTLDFGLERLFKTGFADRDSVGVGFYKRSTFGVIGNRVWDDLNRDGVQDLGEPGIGSQELELEQYVREGDDWVRTAYVHHEKVTSNADGYYYFTEVPSLVYDADDKPMETKYQVVVKRLVTGYTFTKTNVGDPDETANTVDSDFYTNGGMHGSGQVGDHLISVVEIDEATGVPFGKADNTVHLGLVKHALTSLSGDVFIDTDSNGVKDDAATADPFYTATLEVKLPNGDWVAARQDADGYMIEPAFATEADAVMQQVGETDYNFENLHIIDNERLTAYEYRVKTTLIPLWQAVTSFQQGADHALDNDFKQVERTVTNTADSDTRIVGKPNADHLLKLETFVGVPATHVDLGLVSLTTQVTIGDFVWDDVNRDGIQDAGEPGINDLRVVLNRVVDGELVFVEETQTDADGMYEFTANVADQDPSSARFNQPHTYAVEFNLTSRQSLSPLKAGGDDAINSKFVNLVNGGTPAYGQSVADPAHTAVSEEFTLVPADANGYAQYESAQSTDKIDGGVVTHDTVWLLGDTVYEDTNADGVQDADEPGIAGMNVSIFNLNHQTGRWEAYVDTEGNSSATTDADGKYEFAVEIADLDKESPYYRAAEQYRVLVEAPANLRLVEINSMFSYQGSTDVDGIPVAKPYSYVLTDSITMVDTHIDPVTDTEGVNFDSAHDVLEADAGFTVYNSQVVIGGRVWEDEDHDGLQGQGTGPDTGSDAGSDTDEGASGGGTEAPEVVTAEVGIAGRAVTLLELVDGEWIVTEDLNGNSVVETDEDGYYSFTVSPTHYDQAEANFLAPREYRVRTERDGYQQWSPLNVGDDRDIDSDITAAEPGTPIGPSLDPDADPDLDAGTASARRFTHTGATHVFTVADLIDIPGVANAVVDVTSVRDDVQMDIGLKTFTHLAIVGGDIWDDANEDGDQQRGEHPLANQRVTLWELIDGDWKVVEDANGNSSQLTDADGHYEFEVYPTEYDLSAEGYLKPREYRTTTNVPSGYQLSEGSEDLTLEGQLVISHSAVISTVDDEGYVDITAIESDLTLSFPFSKVPLAATGGNVQFGFAILVLILGLGIVVVGIRRQRAVSAR